MVAFRYLELKRLDSRLTLVHILFLIHAKYLLSAVLHLSTYLVVMFFPFNRNIHKSKLHFDNSFDASGPLVWNSLPEKVRCCDSLCTFRRQLKGYLCSLSFSSIITHSNGLTFWILTAFDSWLWLWILCYTYTILSYLIVLVSYTYPRLC